MKNEKIFNAMEHLDDKYIAEAMKQYESTEYISLQGEDPVDPRFEGVAFDAEIAKKKNRGRFIKWAGYAAAVCVVAAGALFLISGGNTSLPDSPLSGSWPDNTQTSQTTEIPDEANVIIKDVNELGERFELKQLNITDNDLINQIESAGAVRNGDKLYFVKQSEDLKKAAICAYDTKGNTVETVFEKSVEKPDVITDLAILYIYEGSIYYLDTEYTIIDNEFANPSHTCICKYDMKQKTYSDIYLLPTYDDTKDNAAPVWTGKKSLGATRKATDGYLFYESGTYISETEEKLDIIRYDMESGETITFKENAEIFDIWKDKLLFIRKDAGQDNWRLLSCDAASGENEETLGVLSNEIEYDNVCYDGKTLWAVQSFGRSPEDVKGNARYGFELRRLNENGEFETVSKVYDLLEYKIKSLQNLIVSDLYLYDVQNNESIIIDNKTNKTLLSVIGNNLYSVDRSDSEAKVYMLFNPSTIA